MSISDAYLAEPLLVGQGTLLSVLDSSRAQSYLVSTPARAGCEDVARLLARFWLGVAPMDDPADLVVYDDLKMASVRQAIEEAWTKPIELSRRAIVVILGPRPTREVQNALLRLTEEPPPHLGIFLAVTSAQRIPATLRSRLVPLIPRPLPTAEMETWLRANQRLTAERAHQVALSSGGWIGRARALAVRPTSALEDVKPAARQGGLGFIAAAEALPKDKRAWVDDLADELEGLSWSTHEPRYALAAAAAARARQSLDRNGQAVLVAEVLLQELAELGVLGGVGA